MYSFQKCELLLIFSVNFFVLYLYGDSSFTKELKDSQPLKGDKTSVNPSLFWNRAPFPNISSIQIDCFHVCKTDKTEFSIVSATDFLRRVSGEMKHTNLTVKSV